MYDLIIKQAQLLDNRQVDIAIKDGKIAAIQTEITASASRVLDVGQQGILTAGWIDSHVHCFEKMDLYYDYPDKIGIEQGVTTVIDAGSTGGRNVGDFYDLAKQAKTNVYALLNISQWGIVSQDELADLANIKVGLIQTSIAKYPDFIIGLKVRMSRSVIGENGIIPLKKAKEIQALVQLPLMVHIGSAPPELADILACLSAGDIVTHCFNGKENGILGTNQQIKDFVQPALDRGIIFDIGHGTDSFNFQVAEIAKQARIKATTISTDIYQRNRQNGPVYNLATTLEKMLTIGYSLSEVIEKVTVNPATLFNLTSKGKIAVGYDADFTLFVLQDDSKELIDSNQQIRQSRVSIIPKLAIIGGEVYHVD